MNLEHTTDLTDVHMAGHPSLRGEIESRVETRHDVGNRRRGGDVKMTGGRKMSGGGRVKIGEDDRQKRTREGR